MTPRNSSFSDSTRSAQHALQKFGIFRRRLVGRRRKPAPKRRTLAGRLGDMGMGVIVTHDEDRLGRARQSSLDHVRGLDLALRLPILSGTAVPERSVTANLAASVHFVDPVYPVIIR